ncbi:VOC family protein [Richelia intracellularis]|uniref:VOC family protein n=1 Tax=Richelia intracellularis TaxID=1164990 RepID=UPI0005C5017D|nr:VOC family protein [Richelia intracellularis]
MHHVSIRTADIHRAIAFYEQLGFNISERFTTGYTLACWMEGISSRIELIQIPEPKPAPNIFADLHYVGYYHLSFDVTEYSINLSSYLNYLQDIFIQKSQENPEKFQPLVVMLGPTQQKIGDSIYEVAFISDTDGLPIEIIRILTTLKC